jgi:hypothetical protein
LDNAATDQTSLSDAQKSDSKYFYDKQQKNFFLTLNNPLEYGYTHDVIIDAIHAKFKNTLYWCMCDEQGSTYHTHIYILLSKKKRWSAVQNAFKHSHIETQVHGSPQQCRAYIRKEGDRYSDKAETNFPDTFYEEGNIPSFVISSDRQEMLQQIGDMLDSGMRPSEILQLSVAFMPYDSIIRKSFFLKQYANTPPLREITVVWHLGASGSGKTYSYVNLCEEHGADSVFYASDFSNSCTALLDNYQAEPFLFIDEVKPDSFKYGYLQQLLQGYRTPIHARYANVYSLWDQVDISSIYTPLELYNGMVEMETRSIDSLTQLTRRITKYVYHWKTDHGEFCSYELPACEFISYEDIRQRAEGISSDFKPLNDEPTPFQEESPPAGEN